jgi:hypothetical protein
LIPHLKIRIASSLALEEFLAPNPLRVCVIANFEPSRVIAEVRIGFPLRDDAFEIVSAREPEQQSLGKLY